MTANFPDDRCPKCAALGGRHGTVHRRYGNGGGGNVPCPNHDPRCIRLTDSEFNGSCDCRTWKLIDANQGRGAA